MEERNPNSDAREKRNVPEPILAQNHHDFLKAKEI